MLLDNIAFLHQLPDFIVTIDVRTPDGKGFLLNQAKDLFIWGTGAIMTECSS